MVRTVKDPHERKKQLLDVAMRLFAEMGYDNVSVRSVARAAGVASGLAYHYFDSKEALFSAAIKNYSCQCAEEICSMLDNNELSLEQKLDAIIVIVSNHNQFEYSSFFHSDNNRALHDRLSLGICEEVKPHLQRALELDAALSGFSDKDAETLASMMTYSCIELFAMDPEEMDLNTIKRFLDALIAEYRKGYNSKMK